MLEFNFTVDVVDDETTVYQALQQTSLEPKYLTWLKTCNGDALKHVFNKFDDTFTVTVTGGGPVDRRIILKLVHHKPDLTDCNPGFKWAAERAPAEEAEPPVPTTRRFRSVIDWLRDR